MEAKKMKYFNIEKIIVSFLLLFLLAMPGFVFANDAVKGLNEAANQGFLGSAGTSDIEEGSGLITSIPGAIGRIIGVVLSFVGVMFFLLMIYGGFMWMFSRGNDAQVQQAKSLITAAVVGLIIVMMAYAITVFIGTVLTEPGSPSLPRI